MPLHAAPADAGRAAPPPRVARGLDALNVFLADVRDGLGPYLAIYLLAVCGPEQGWNEATIGLVITLSAIAGLLAQTPAGALIDRTRNKRGVVVAAVTLSCVALPFIQGFALVAATQSLAGIAGAVFPPALAAITLGAVGPRAFARRIGRNEGFNHAGNAASAALAAGTAYLFGPVVVFWIMAGLALASIGAVLAIPASAIDDDAARGLGEASGGPYGSRRNPRPGAACSPAGRCWSSRR
jgi:MFS family permease